MNMKSAAESSERDAPNTSSSAGELTPELVRATLDKILASPGFVNAERLTPLPPLHGRRNAQRANRQAERIAAGHRRLWPKAYL